MNARGTHFSAALFAAMLLTTGAHPASAQNETQNEPAPYGTIYLLPRHPVYAFLDRLSTKGLLPHAPLNTRPWTRMQLANALLEVPPDDRRLTATDRSRLRFYLGEFAEEIEMLGCEGRLADVEPAWWSNHARERSRYLRPFRTYRRDGAHLRLWAAGAFDARYDTSETFRRHVEIGGWLRLGDHWGMQAAFRDVAEWGPDVAPPPPFGTERGTAFIDGDTSKVFYYDDTEAMVSYGARFFTVSLGVYPLVLGPGTHAQVILSDNAPPLPQVRLTIHPWPWLTFTYVHTSLQSGVPDTTSFWSRIEPENTGYLDKYFVAHRLEFTAIRGVNVGLTESVVYGGRGVSLRYVVPVVPFRPAQHAEADLDNLQMSADITLTRLPSTKLYGTFLVDELSLDAASEEEDIHEWWVWQVGAKVADLWGLLPNVDTGVEYTRANPWVYRHKYPWNTYDTWALKGNEARVAYPLGFWQGHNGDYLRGDLVWRPTRDVELSLSASQARRGGEGTAVEQYNPPAEPFLFGPVTRTREVRLEATWEARRDLFIRAHIGHVNRTHTKAERSTERNWARGSLGVTYNVW